jgi:hypothetical protein
MRSTSYATFDSLLLGKIKEQDDLADQCGHATYLP